MPSAEPGAGIPDGTARQAHCDRCRLKVRACATSGMKGAEEGSNGMGVEKGETGHPNAEWPSVESHGRAAKPLGAQTDGLMEGVREEHVSTSEGGTLTGIEEILVAATLPESQ